MSSRPLGAKLGCSSSLVSVSIAGCAPGDDEIERRQAERIALRVT